MKKIYLSMGIGMIGAGFVFILLIPSFLSSAFTLEKALTHIDKHKQSTGSLTVQDCSIGWFKGLVCHEVNYKDYINGLSLNIKQLSGDRGFLALIAAPGNPGVIHISQPVFELTARPDDSHMSAGRNKKNNEKTNRLSGVIDEIPFWERYIIGLVVEDGRFIFNSSESFRADAPSLSADFSLALRLSSGTVDYKFEWSGDKKGGTMIANGVVNLPAGRINFFETIVFSSEVRLEQLQLAPFGELLSLYTDIFSGSGMVDGSFTVAGSGREQLDLFGHLDFVDMKFKSDLAGDGYGGFRWMSVSFDGDLSNGDHWLFNELIIESEYGKLEASGNISSASGEFSLRAFLQMNPYHVVAGRLNLLANGFFFPYHLIVRDMDIQIRDLVFAGDDGLTIIQDELFVSSVKTEKYKDIPVNIQGLELEKSMEWWQKSGGGLSGYDWQEKRLFANNLKVDGELGDESVFAWVHPLFGVLTTASGRPALRVDYLYLPVITEGKNEARFSVMLDVSEVVFESRERLTEAFNFLQIDGQPLEVKGERIFCKGKGGRINCLPVMLLAGNTEEVIIIGSTGMDQSLDYLLRTPLREGLPALPEIRLQGTITDPVYSRADG